MIITLTDFPLARIEEDEADARAADALGQIAERITTSSCQEFADHIARWQPLRVLADCEARREVVQQYAAAVVAAAEEGWVKDGVERALELTIKTLATVHADHPDFDEAWRP